MGTVWKDLRYAVRVLAKSPAFTAVVVVSLALGIGANTAIFSIVNAYLLCPMPVDAPDRLVAIYATAPRFGNDTAGFSYSDLLDYRNHQTAFTDLMGSSGIPLSLTGADKPQLIWGEVVTGNYFSGLGVRPVLGRGFLPEEDRAPGEKAVCVLNFNFWKKNFGSDPEIAGKAIKINGRQFTIVGVAPRGFIGTTLFNFVPDVWVPVMMQRAIAPNSGDFLVDRGNRWISLRGRLKPGVSRRQAEAELNVVAQQLAKEYPKTNRDMRIHLIPGGARTQPALVASGVVSVTTGIMTAVVVLVLLIASANVANMLIARGTGRAREMSIRVAVGASRTRLIRQLLTESVLLSVLGGALGILLALWFSDLLKGFYPSLDFQTADLDYETRLDPRIFPFTFLLSLATAVLFGLAPALRSSKADHIGAMRGAIEFGRNRIGRGNLLIMGQVALSCVLLISGGLFLRSMQFARNVDPGFDRSGISMFSIDLDLQGYDAARGRTMQSNLLQRLRALPGVSEASLASPLPLDAYDSSSNIFPEGYVPRSDSENNSAGLSRVGPDYFKTMGTQLVAGRGVTERDRDGAPLVAVVNQAMAERYWQTPDQAIGRKFSTQRGGPPIQVIGVAKNGKYASFGEGATPYYFAPLAQNYQGRVTALMRSRESLAALLPAIRQKVSESDPSLPVFGARSMPVFLNRMVSIYEMGASLVGTFAVMALLLAIVGIYGVLHFTVARRTREIGIRMALGARRGQVLQLVLKRSLMFAALGVCCGVGLALAAARVTGSLLAGVSGRDPVTFLGVIVVFVVIAVLASAVPARRATRVDPMEALRYE